MDYTITFRPHHSTERAEIMGLKADRVLVEVTQASINPYHRGVFQKVIVVWVAKTKRELIKHLKAEGFLPA